MGPFFYGLYRVFGDLEVDARNRALRHAIPMIVLAMIVGILASSVIAELR